MAVAIEVHGVSTETARHELWQAHGASIRPLEGDRIDLFLTGKQQKFAQLLAEERRTRRIIEGQGRQGVHHPPTAGVAAIEGFHADDGDDELRRHTVLGFGLLQCSLVVFPEFHAVSDTLVGDEDRPVVLPGLDLLCRARDGIENRLLALNLGEQADQLLAGKTIVAGHFLDELGHLRRAVIISCQSGTQCAGYSSAKQRTDSPTAQRMHQLETPKIKPERSTFCGCESPSISRSLTTM